MAQIYQTTAKEKANEAGGFYSIAHGLTQLIREENPDFTEEQCKDRSEDILHGYRLKMFLLRLSLVPRFLLDAITLGATSARTLIYEQTALKEFYAFVKERPLFRVKIEKKEEISEDDAFLENFFDDKAEKKAEREKVKPSKPKKTYIRVMEADNGFERFLQKVLELLSKGTKSALHGIVIGAIATARFAKKSFLTVKSKMTKTTIIICSSVLAVLLIAGGVLVYFTQFAGFRSITLSNGVSVKAYDQTYDFMEINFFGNQITIHPDQGAKKDVDLLVSALNKTFGFNAHTEKIKDRKTLKPTDVADVGAYTINYGKDSATGEYVIYYVMK